MEMFLESCRVNESVHWLFFSDHRPPEVDIPPNVRFEKIGLDRFLRWAERALGIDIAWDNPYKICELRPGFGVLFQDHVRDYRIWGWGDIDVIYGDMKLHLTEDVLDHDCISFSKAHLSGHLCLWRNDERVRTWFRRLPDWRARMENVEYTHLDECPPEAVPSEFRVHAEYSFNTPLSPKTPWTDGTFNCPREWYWKGGSLTTDIDGDREFLYLHFMHWKGGGWPRRCGNAQWEKLDKLVHLEPGQARFGFRVNERGFFPLAR